MSNDDDQLKSAVSATAIVCEIIKTAGQTPEAKEAAKNVGTTAVTITKTINNILLPIAALNFAFDKARIYFSENFNKDLSEKACNIPPENLVEPKASIAGPVLQGLAFTHEEVDLKNMYLNLLKTSMDNRTAEKAHPAFVEVIKQLTSEEAILLKDFFVNVLVSEAIVEIKLKGKIGSRTLCTHVMNSHDENTNLPVEAPDLPAKIDNWIRLGLVNVDYTAWLTQPKRYEWADTRPEVIKHKSLETADSKIQIRKGIIKRTAFGTEFAKAAGLSDK